MTRRQDRPAPRAWMPALGCAIALAAGGLHAQPTGTSGPQVHQAEVAGAAASPAQIKAGEQVFQTVCMACHQADGKGIPGAFPPLAGSDFLLGGKERAVGVVVNGLEGEVVVNGSKFNSVMPAMVQLSDQEIADALTYAMNSWGNSLAPSLRRWSRPNVRAPRRRPRRQTRRRSTRRPSPC